VLMESVRVCNYGGRGGGAGKGGQEGRYVANCHVTYSMHCAAITSHSCLVNHVQSDRDHVMEALSLHDVNGLKLSQCQCTRRMRVQSAPEHEPCSVSLSRPALLGILVNSRVNPPALLPYCGPAAALLSLLRCCRRRSLASGLRQSMRQKTQPTLVSQQP
jgi:hypothetical protein